MFANCKFNERQAYNVRSILWSDAKGCPFGEEEGPEEKGLKRTGGAVNLSLLREEFFLTVAYTSTSTRPSHPPAWSGLSFYLILVFIYFLGTTLKALA